MQEYSHLTDEELAEKAISDSDALYELFHRYEKKLKNYILKISYLSVPCSEDILQETFIKIYKNLSAFETSLKFSSWIYRVTHNETINYLRKNKKHLEIASTENEEQIDYLNLFKNSLEIEEKFITREIKTKVREIIKNMPLKYREVIILKYIEDKSYDEISDILQKPIGTISALIYRAKKYFKQIAIKENLHQLI
ncbi:hypothetical protein A2483_04120 [Candidatus Peregrinibacteria bacterium RIFOXYC2_FULL_33_13]|nr:MAG: RNA polymerase, sigma-24 subunit, ECF subfamily [Candidatus Peregrinibacteria bacterium GW2011_GWA2_33_10]KKP41002.1 MAG: ECF subfamily RNA polymerase sigma-24 subunit, RNA polymerase sigma-70 factor, ECF subfamily [Candidatus Peregrinibacteria bacterium GW2011_GWC2_33_13]OGJ49653.1 MAG: hypothetical protein A2229_03755 [Candidatus Peregrinibacteria bacterium RIFOXYA2_FULL_33_7]OGJ54837.1 MAG: hypothetical protein A2483_04120 [Candidatus Peregrinibacteria bacterium RIFOXYC2_FULL_33_13]